MIHTAEALLRYPAASMMGTLSLPKTHPPLEWRRPRDYTGLFLLFLQVIDEEGDVLAENAYLHSAAPPPI